MPSPEIRKHPFLNRRVIIAEERDQRPNDFADGSTGSLTCPFCAGNEAETPAPIATYAGDGDGWQVRVVPNKYPAIGSANGHPDKRDMSAAIGIADSVTGSAAARAAYRHKPSERPAVQLFQRQPAEGYHEVIVESPRHVTGLPELSRGDVTLVMRAYRDRLAVHRDDPQIAYSQLFKNCGKAAGATLHHIHSQLIALPIVPSLMAEELAHAASFWEQGAVCGFCAMLSDELRQQDRIVLDSDAFMAICPFASTLPYEMWVLPKLHQPHFDALDDLRLAELGEMLQQLIIRLEKSAGSPAYNYLVRTSPFDTGCEDYYHWHIELFPRLNYQAGFEWGSGFTINPISPENAAKRLRQA